MGTPGKTSGAEPVDLLIAGTGSAPERIRLGLDAIGRYGARLRGRAPVGVGDSCRLADGRHEGDAVVRWIAADRIGLAFRRAWPGDAPDAAPGLDPAAGGSVERRIAPREAAAGVE